MDSLYPDPIAPGASVQLTALAAACAGVLVVALAASAWSRRRRGEAVTLAMREAQASPLLTGAAMLAVLTLASAVAIRQLWPHPDLGVRLLWGWLLLVVPVALVWLSKARS